MHREDTVIEKKAADIMTSVVHYVSAETPVREIAKVLLQHNVSAVPVVGSSGKLVGIVSEGDLIGRAASDDGQRRSWWLDMIERSSPTSMELRNYLEIHGLRAKDVMSGDVVAVEEDTRITVIAELLERKRIKRVPVLRKGQMVGIVSRADLLRSLAQMY
jgi:CBS domain-containing protein